MAGAVTAAVTVMVQGMATVIVMPVEDVMRMPGRMGTVFMAATAAAGDMDGTAKRASDGWPVNRTERADDPLFFYASGNDTERKEGGCLPGTVADGAAVAGVVVCGHGMVSPFTVSGGKAFMMAMACLSSSGNRVLAVMPRVASWERMRVLAAASIRKDSEWIRPR